MAATQKKFLVYCTGLFLSVSTFGQEIEDHIQQPGFSLMQVGDSLQFHFTFYEICTYGKPASWDENDKARLKAILSVLQENQSLRLRIENHTDCRGSAAYNQALSQHRAAQVREWFIERSISPDQLEAVGFGESAPLNDCDRDSQNCSEEALLENRRTVFRLLN